VKRNWLLYLVIFSLALNFGTIGTFVYLRYQDQTQRTARELSPPLPLYALWKSLNLDASQRRALHGLFPKHRDKVTELRGALFQKRQELFGLIKDEPPDQTAIQAKVREISGLQGQLEEELMRFLLEFKKRLKPEQTTVFLNLVQTRLDKALGGHWGPRGGPGLRRGPGMGRGPGTSPGPGMGPPPEGGPGPGSCGPVCPE
jgi:Spy/CpxP family protein refolding chaperone